MTVAFKTQPVNQNLKIRVTEDQKAYLTEKAQERGQTISDLIRELLDNHL